MARLKRDEIIQAWTLLGELAHRHEHFVELRVVGGAVMAVHFRSRDATADVDAIFNEPAQSTRSLAAQVACELGLNDDWLNDAAKGYVTIDSLGPILHESLGIRVQSLSFPHLLALKLMAWRDDVDIQDAEVLFRRLKTMPEIDVSSPDNVLKAVEPYLLESHKLRACYAIQELWELINDDESGTNSH